MVSLIDTACFWISTNLLNERLAHVPYNVADKKTDDKNKCKLGKKL